MSHQQEDNLAPATRDSIRTAIEVAISLSLISLLLLWCFRILQPFLPIIVWGAIIAIALAVPVGRLDAWLGSRRRAVLLFTASALVILLVPAYLFADSLIGGLRNLRLALETSEFSLPLPSEAVRDWPLVGEKLYQAWQAAAQDTQAWLADNVQQLRPILGGLLGRLAGVGLSVLQFGLSIVVAAMMLIHAEAAEAATRRLLARLMGGEQDQGLLNLSVATIRSVTVGVLGIAVIQALGAGVGMVAVGVPAAGLLALVVLVLAVAQLPPWLVLLPVVVLVFSEHSTPVAVVFAVWSLIVSVADMFLKPLLLGRGVEAPMPVILIGAIGGMLMSGIIGLFTGAVILALGYRLLQAWLNDDAGQSQPVASTPS
jgi:predicted PurR-regulated permease PerM